MMHQADERDNHAIIRIDSELSFVSVCFHGDIGFYALRILFRDKTHKQVECKAIREVFEHRENAIAFAEEMENWG